MGIHLSRQPGAGERNYFDLLYGEHSRSIDGVFANTSGVVSLRKMCATCDYATLKPLLTPTDGILHATCVVSLSTVCNECTSWVERKLKAHSYGCVPTIETFRVFIPNVLHKLITDHVHLKIMTSNHKIHSAFTHAVRNYGDHDELEKKAYVGKEFELEHFKLCFRGWATQIYEAETRCVVAGCWNGVVAETYWGQTEHWNLYRPRSIEGLSSGYSTSTTEMMNTNEAYEEVLENSSTPGVLTISESEVPIQPLLPGATITVPNRERSEGNESFERVGNPLPANGVTLVGPMAKKMECFKDSVRNVVGASNQRILPPGNKRKFNPKPFLKRKIDKAVDAIIKTVLTPKAILNEILIVDTIDSFKSHSWSAERYANALDMIMNYDPLDLRPTSQIKSEGTECKGKAPRLIANEGEPNQVIDSVPIGVYEHVFSRYFKLHNVKEKTSDERHKLIGKMGGFESVFVEGDGTAWDSCIGSDCKAAIEGRLIQHVIDVLNMPFCDLPVNAWKDARSKRGNCKKTTHKLTEKDKKKEAYSPNKLIFHFTFRSSGDRGTSVLNYTTNLVLWLAITCAFPDRVIENARNNIKIKYICAFTGQEYWISFIFEGDDSLIRLPMHISNSFMENGRKISDEITNLWHSVGFQMKLNFHHGLDGDEVVEFCGVHYLVSKGNIEARMHMPDISRNIINSTTTSSKMVKKNPTYHSSVAYASHMSRAANFASYQPAADWFAANAQQHQSGELHSGDQRHVEHKVGHNPDREFSLPASFDEAINVGPSVGPLTSENFAIMSFKRGGKHTNAALLTNLSAAPGLSPDETPSTACAHAAFQ